MRKARKKQQQEQNKLRFEAVKNLMSTFAMGTVAVVAAVVIIPSSPKAEILKTAATEEEIIYQVSVTDEDNAIDNGSLVVVLENQLEYYYQPIDLGESSGYFSDLEEHTEYRLSVYGDKGFGNERLATTLIKTYANEGGYILSVNPISSGYETSYSVDVSIYDPDGEYSSISLTYGTKYEEDGEYQYQSVPITDSLQTIVLENLYTEQPIHILLEGVSSSGSKTLDEIMVTPPYNLNASVYLESIAKRSVGFYAYGEHDIDLTFIVNVYSKGMLLDSVKYTPPTYSEYDHYEESSGSIKVTGLAPNTTYLFECIAVYDNPQTLNKEESIIFHEEITTLNNYKIDYSYEETEDEILVEISIDDPNYNFDYATYEIYDTSGEYDMYYSSYTYALSKEDNISSITFSIPKPALGEYKIIIKVANNTNYIIHHKIDEIHLKGE